MRKFISYFDGHLYKIKLQGGGVVPNNISGGYTSDKQAKEVIANYVEYKIEKDTPSKHQLAVKARRERNAKG